MAASNNTDHTGSLQLTTSKQNQISDQKLLKLIKEAAGDVWRGKRCENTVLIESIWRQSHFLHYTVDVWTQTFAYLHCAVVLSAFLCVNSLRLDKRRDDRLTRRLQMVQWERGLTQEV